MAPIAVTIPQCVALHWGCARDGHGCVVIYGAKKLPTASHRDGCARANVNIIDRRLPWHCGEIHRMQLKPRVAQSGSPAPLRTYNMHRPGR